MREPGYYWVKYKNRDWEVAEYHDGKGFGAEGWHVTGDWQTVDDSTFEEIDERRITREA